MPARGRKLVSTGMSIAIPEYTMARICPRSGLAARQAIGVDAGVVDYDYRGEVGVLLTNSSDEDFPVQAGDRIAQLVVERISMCTILEVEDLPGCDSNRDNAGWGSSGYRALTTVCASKHSAAMPICAACGPDPASCWSTSCGSSACAAEPSSGSEAEGCASPGEANDQPRQRDGELSAGQGLN